VEQFLEQVKLRLLQVLLMEQETFQALTLQLSAVISKVLTGYASGPGVVAATDSILAAIQKLNRILPKWMQ
jgi:hypothetical protein